MKKLKSKERQPALQAAINALTARANQLVAPIARAPLTETEAAIAALDPTLQKGAAARITWVLKKCPRCDAHHLQLSLTHFTVDKKDATNVVGTFDKTNVPQPEVA